VKNKKAQKDRAVVYRPWTRRLRRAAVCILLLVLALRITLWISLPWLLNQSVRRVGLQCVYEELDLSLLTGDMEVWHLKLMPIDSNDPLVDMEYCRTNVSIRSLFSRHLIVDRVEVDGIDITVTRESDGTFKGLDDLVTLVRARAPSGNPVSPKPDTSASIAKLDLEPPFRLRALRLQHVQVHYQDQSVTPPVDTLLDMTLRVSNLGFMLRQTRFQLTVACEPILNQFVMEGTAKSTSHTLMTEFVSNVRGLHAAPLAGYLGPLGISAACETIEAGFQGKLTLTTGIQPPSDANTAGAPRLEAGVALAQAFLKADGRDMLGLDQFTMTANMPDQQTVNITHVDCTQGAMHIWLREHDVVELAGLRFQKPATPSSASTPPTKPASPVAWSLSQLNVAGLSLHLHDTLATPATDSTVTLDRFTIGDLRRDSAGHYTQATVQAQLSAPGIFRTAQLQGKADLISLEKYLNASFSIDGFAPTGLSAYLNQMGLESQHKDGFLSGHLQADLIGPRDDGSLHLNAQITDLRAKDPNELFALDRIVIDQLEVNPLTQKLHVNAIDISGQRFPIQRNQDKSYSVLGFTIRPPKSKTSRPSVNTRPEPVDSNETQAPPAIPAGSVTIERFSWQNNQIELIDQAASSDQATIFPVTYGLDINDVQWGALDPNTPSHAAQIDFWCKAPGVAESLRLNGTVTPAPPGFSFDLEVRGRELNSQRLTPYLKPLGIEPVFTQAQLAATLKGQITPQSDGLKASVAVSEILFSEPNQTWVKLKSVSVQDLTLQGPSVTVGDLQIHDPVLSLTRDANGALVTCGLRLLPQKAQPETPTIEPVAIPVQLKQFALSGGQLLWQDHSVQPSVYLNLDCDASLDQFQFNSANEPSTLFVQLAIPSILQSLQISGQAAIGSDHVGANLNIKGTGINLIPLAPYFQESLQPTLTNGQFSASLQTTIDTHDTEQKAEIQLRDLILVEEGQETPLMRMDHATAKLAITEPNTLSLHEISINGLEALAQKTETGRFEILGLVCAQPASPVIPALTEPARATDVNAPAKPATTPTRRWSLTELPTVILESLDLNIASLTYVDRSQPQAAPIIAQNIRLRNTAPSKLLSHDLETAQPLHLDLSGAIVPLMDSFQITTKLTPFDAEPTATIDLDIQGIHGQGFTDICPDLKTIIDGTNLKNGRLKTKLLAVMRLPRHTLLDFDPNQAFELTLQLTDLALSEQNEPDLLAGLKEMHAELPVINLGKKDILIKRLEMIEPQCRVRKTAQGLHVMNILIKLPDANAPRPASDVNVLADRPSEPKILPVEETPLNLRVDQFVASGLDFTFTDETIVPPLDIPLTGMDIELRGWSTQPGAKPIHLNAIVSAGKVALPLRQKKMPKQDPNAPPLPTHEEIRLFQEITVMGRVIPGLEPTGWIKAGLSGLELRHLSAAAQPSGVMIKDGVLDASVDVRLKGNGKARVKTRLILSDLNLDESKDGPLTKTLKLPAPLDTTLFILRGSDGTIRLPLDFTVTDKGVSSSQIATAAFGSASAVIAKAIAGAPLRPVNTVARLLGGGQDKEMGPAQETTLSYSGGALELSPSDQATLDALVKQVQKDPHAQMTIQHQLGSADLAYAEQLVNPSQQESLELLNQLKHRKQHLLAERARLLVEAQVAYVTSTRSMEILVITGQLRSTSRQLGLIETALDTLLDTLRSGADHARRRRTREGALAIAQARLSTLNSTLSQKTIAHYERRVKISAPSFAGSEEFHEGRITISLVKTKAK